MKAVSRFGLVLVVALTATALVTGRAQAQTPVSFVAQNPTLAYESALFECETGTADGTVDTNVYELALEFFNCDVHAAAAEVDCEGTVEIIPQNDAPPGGTGTVQLNSDFLCTITIAGVCTISIAGPQTTQSDNVLFGEDSFEVDAAFFASKSGSSACGPSSGTGNWAGVYEEVP